ncbi:RNA polymerase sigma factor [Paenibacillus filicis]|uniref:RNA polymerase sigma factor n=1 Tax=Paenibacillus gyeongsangnamensis TaxID=3388067 RepID=A0ABT4QBK8_9BACL|nr:RNA polymerase sigma factor [Paenibacillus filicis]MCZ8514214.1 RNA polymerase sigma factor [Paenibacillus filicis]
MPTIIDAERKSAKAGRRDGKRGGGPEKTAFRLDTADPAAVPAMTDRMKKPAANESKLQPGPEESVRFAALIEPYRSALETYCRFLARSPWEADDLAQDTWLKAYGMFLRDPSREDMSKAYLCRIARNTWIDRCRRKRRAADLISGEAGLCEPAQESEDPFKVRTAIEALVEHLPPRQRVILLLIDTLGFTAAETAMLIRSTEGAVKAGLHRAREKLRTIRGRGAETPDRRLQPTSKDRPQVDEQVVYAYLQAFRQHNFSALIRLLNDETSPADLLPAVTGSAAVNKPGTSSGMSPRSLLMAA